MSEPPRKRGRGKNKNRWLNQLPDGQKLHIDFDSKNRPIGPNTSKMAQYIGLLARDGNRFPITKQKWKEVDEEQKKKAVSEIKLMCDVPDASDKLLSKELNRKWKDHKCSTKRKFYTDVEDKSECKKSIPPGIVSSQWLTMVQLWDTNDDIKKLAEQNARNRAALKLNHHLGSKSLAQVSHEFRQENEREPTRVDLFEKAYTSKDNGVDPNAVEQLKDMEQRKEIATQNADGEFEDLPGPNDIFAQVMGPERSGRIRLMPHVKPKDLFPRQSSTTNKKIEQELSNIKEQNVELREENAELKEKLCNVTSEVSSLKAQMTQVMNFMRSQGASSSS